MGSSLPLALVKKGKKWPSIWGLTSFLDWAKGNYYALIIDEDVPRSKVLIPGYEEILKTVCGFYGIDEDDLYKAKRGVTNEPRNVSIYWHPSFLSLHFSNIDGCQLLAISY